MKESSCCPGQTKLFIIPLSSANSIPAGVTNTTLLFQIVINRSVKQ